MNTNETQQLEVPVLARTLHAREVTTHRNAGALSTLVGSPSRQAFWALRVGFTVAPIAAGLDKFFHTMVDWDKYVAPFISDLFGGDAHAFMLIVGAVEIAAGIGVAIRPRIFAYVVSAWLLGIIVNLLMIPGYYDIALRDLGLAIAALALGRLSETYGRVQRDDSSSDEKGVLQ